MSTTLLGKEQRIALVGARRVRQGLGPFVARYLVREGAQLAGFVGGSPANHDATTEELRRIAGVHTRGYDGLAELVAAERPTALAILCPAEHHGRYLRQALELRLPTLCEKPLLWSDDGERDLAEALELAEGFAAAGLPLIENCQWPHVIAAGRELLGEGRDSPPRSFAMGLEPASTGLQMVGDCLPHPLSALQALLPGEGRLEGLQCRWSQDRRALDLDFEYRTAHGPCSARIELRSTQRTPRGAWFELDGVRFERLVRPSDYAMFLAVGPRVQDLHDPLETHVRAFLRMLSQPPAAPQPSPIAQRAGLLAQLRSACEAPSP